MVYQIVACHKDAYKDAETSQKEIENIIKNKLLVNPKNPSKPLGALYALSNA